MRAVLYRFGLLLLPSLFVLLSCDSSLDVGTDNRKEIPLDPADTTTRIIPDDIDFELYVKDGWDDSRRRVNPVAGSAQITLDTARQTPVLWIAINYELDELVTSKNSTTKLRLRRLQLRADSVAADRLYQLSGSPNNGNGTSVSIIRYDNTLPLDSLAIIPPSQPSQVQSYSTLSLAPANGAPGTKKITGVYTFSAILYDETSQQIITLPLEGLVSVYFH